METSDDGVRAKISVSIDSREQRYHQSQSQTQCQGRSISIMKSDHHVVVGLVVTSRVDSYHKLK